MTTWSLPTASGAYTVALAPQRAGLVLHQWGTPGGETVVEPRQRITGFKHDLDIVALEATALGTRDVHAVEIVARRSDGLRGLRLVLTGDVTLNPDEDGTHLVCPLADEVAGVAAELHIRTSTAHDVVEKWAVIRNHSPHVVELLRCWGGSFEAATGCGASVQLRHGMCTREVQVAVVDLTAGSLSVGSRHGITSHNAAPTLTVRPRGTTAQDAWSVALAWSGSWRMSVGVTPFVPRVRIAGGVDDESGIMSVAPGGEVTTPVLAGLRTHGDDSAVARAWHRYERGLSRTQDAYHRPVVYNSWYATTFDVRVEHQIELARAAAELGAEAFVVDDGWFRGRVGNAAGLGDWEPDPVKFPDGLGPLADAVTAQGMRFGIWVEPEGVNPDSDLYRAHPDWVHRVAGRPLRMMRNQYVLDFGQPEVQDWAMQMLRRLLTSSDITFLKWDMNRVISDGGQTIAGGDDWSWQHTHGYYRVMDMLRQEFPHVTIEACAGGGGRFDLAVLRRCDVVWASDETGPRDRLAIQHGFTGIYPNWMMSSWVTDQQDVLDREPASFDFRFVVAMAGALGIGGDVPTWPPNQRARAAEHVVRYKRIRDVLFTGQMQWTATPADRACAVCYSVGDRSVVLAWRRAGGQLSVPIGEVRLDANYLVEFGSGEAYECRGDELAQGLVMRWSWDDCDIVEIVCLGITGETSPAHR